jgi:NADPH-dependent 2,4-dienoyl-CoA reductase/sulfur reductase-like enzyme
VRLATIASQIQSLIRDREFSPSNDELDGEIAHLVGDFAEKLDGLCAAIKQCEHDAEQAAERAERWRAEATQQYARAEWLKRYAMWCLSQVKGEAHRADFKAKIVRPKGKKVVVHCDPMDLPGDFVKWSEPKPQPDLEQIKAAIEAGEEIEGVSLVDVEPYLRIY